MPSSPDQEQGNQSANKPRADQLIEQFEELKSGRANIESYWQSLHDYFYIEAADSNKTYAPGTELDSTYLWDATTLESADVFASGFMNYLTPPTSKWHRLRHRDKSFADNKRVGDYLEIVSEEVNSSINRSNFYDQIFPSYKCSGVYGTSFILEEEDLKDDIRFYNMPLKQCLIVEDSAGRACAYFLEFEYTAKQAEDKWGREALSKEMQEELKAGKGNNKHKFFLYIAERTRREVQKNDKRNMPIEATWVDVKGRTIIDESGYQEMPAMVHRFDKRPFMPWGFSPAMKALPFARILNAMAKTNLRSMMKHTDPALALPSNAFILPFNQNPRAINYSNKSKMDGRDIFPVGNTGDPQAGLMGIEYYSRQVKSLMYNDVFLAFNNITKEMNNPEVMERINEKMTLLGPAVGRYLSEVLNPIIQRTIGILFRRGKLPEPPEELLMDPGYEIDFIGSLAQAQRRSELNTLTTGLTMMGQMAQFAPEVLDKVSADKVVDQVWAITGAPLHVLRDDAEIQQIREGRAKQQLAAQEMQQALGAAEAGAKAGKAAEGFAKAEGTNK